jgi:hypothetical protein
MAPELCARVSVPLSPKVGPELDAEIRCCIQKLPDALRCDRMY